MSRLPDARRPAVLRRHLLPGRAAPRPAVVPPGARGRRPGLARAARRGRGGRAAGSSTTLVEQSAARRPAPTLPTPALLDAARGRASRPRSTRSTAAGAGRPKFPQPMTIEFLLRRHVATGDAAAARGRAARRSTRWPTAASTTSSAAASTATRPTRSWLVPHFEQMLYDNAQLARVYVHAWALTGDARYRDGRDRDARLHAPRAARRADGAFAASQDADTDGDRGRDVHLARGRDPRGPRATTPALFAAAYGVTDERQLGGPHDPVAGPRRRRARGAVRAAGRPRSAARLAGARARAARPTRRRGRSRPATTRCSRPGTGWRSRPSPTRAVALAATRSGDAADALSRRRDRRPRRDPRRAARGRTARLRRSWKDGRAIGERRARGLRAPRRRPPRAVRGDLRRALVRRRARRSSMDRSLAQFADPGRRLLRHAPTTTSGSSTRPEGRPGQRDAVGQRDGRDRPAAARGADRRGPLPRRGRAGAARRSARSSPATRPAFAQWLSALDLALAPRRRGRDRRRRRRPGDARAPRAWSRRGYRPNQVVAVGRATRRRRRCRCSRDRVALDGRPTAYVCRDFACRLPVTEPEALEALLARRMSVAARAEAG